LKDRFEGADRPNLIDALRAPGPHSRRQGACGSVRCSRRSGRVLKGARLIVEDAGVNDIYLLVAGSVAVVVKGNEVATRRAGQGVDEMA
jgi:hypothetical protein